MASSLAEELKCSICLNLFREPHMLSCGHNFCLPCLESSAVIGQNMDKCPECRIPFSHQELKHNRTLGNLVEKVRQLQLNPEPPPGGALGDICKKHDEPLLFFCKRDLVPICAVCRKQHQGHHFLSIKTAVKYVKGKLERYQTRLIKSLRRVNTNLAVEQKKMLMVETCTEKILKRISRECEELHQVLHSKEENFKNYVEEVKAKNLEEIQDALRPFQKEVSSHDEINLKIKTALEKVDDLAFLKDVKKLINRVKTFQPRRGKIDYSESDEEEEVVTRSYGNTVTPVCSSLKTFNGFPANGKMLRRIQPDTSIRPLFYSQHIEPSFYYDQPTFPRVSHGGMFVLKVVLVSFALCCFMIFAFICFSNEQ